MEIASNFKKGKKKKARLCPYYKKTYFSFTTPWISEPSKSTVELLP